MAEHPGRRTSGLPDGVRRVIPNDLTLESTFREVIDWLSYSCPVEERDSPTVIGITELTELTRHLKEKKLPMWKLDSSESAAVVAKEWLKCADTDGDEALNDEEMRMLWTLLTERKLLIAETATKLCANSANFVFGSRLDWLGGLQRLIPQLTRSVKQECTLNDGGKYKATYEYIVDEAAVERLTGKVDASGKPIIFDQGHKGMRLLNFYSLPQAREAGLTMVSALARARDATRRFPPGRPPPSGRFRLATDFGERTRTGRGRVHWPLVAPGHAAAARLVAATRPALCPCAPHAHAPVHLLLLSPWFPLSSGRNRRPPHVYDRLLQAVERRAALGERRKGV